MTAIIVKNLVKNYGLRNILKTVNLNIEEGEFFALMGPNGSGKTTLASILAGTTPTTSGTVNIHGSDISNQPGKIKSLIGYIPQENFSCPHLTGRENLLYFAQLAGQNKTTAKKWVKDVLEKMELSHDADRLVSQYSGGMRKRLEVATALVPGVKIIILDEPTTGFDPAARKMLLGSLMEINRDGITIFLVTHIGEDAEVAKIVAFMKNGQIIVQDNPRSLKTKFKGRNAIDIKLPIKNSRIFRTLKSINNGRQIVETSDGYKVYCEKPEEIIPLIVNNLNKIGCTSTEVELNPPSLEDIFFFLTKQILTEKMEVQT